MLVALVVGSLIGAFASRRGQPPVTCLVCDQAYTDHVCPTFDVHGAVQRCAVCDRPLLKGTLRQADGRRVCLSCKGKAA